MGKTAFIARLQTRYTCSKMLSGNAILNLEESDAESAERLFWHEKNGITQ
jgi:hypothetical protein